MNNDYFDKYSELKERNTDRDLRMFRVQQIRKGNIDLVAPGLLPESWPKPVVANLIRVSARETAEMLAPMPAIACTPLNSADDAARKRADKRSKIANYYVDASRMASAMLTGADQYITYGFLPFRVEANLNEQRPHIHVEDPMGAYYDKNRWGRVTAYAKRWYEPTTKLIRLFPEHAQRLHAAGSSDRGMTEVVKWYDDDEYVLFSPTVAGAPFARYRNPLSHCPISVAELADIDGDRHGQYDDVVFVYLARAYIEVLKLKAADQAVNAPISLPMDVADFAIGPDAIIRSETPEKVRRVGLDLPNAALIESQTLQQELQVGARHPAARTGNINASVITGKGVEALNGGFDSQIKAGQLMIAEALRESIAQSFELDEIMWGNQEKEVRANAAGQPYALRYRPERDIKSDHTVEVTYGLMSGMDPNHALVFGLQARGDKLMSRDLLRRNMPFNANPQEEEQKVDIEMLRDSLVQATAGYAQALPLMVQQGLDPLQPVKALATAIQSRREGDTVEDAIFKAFAPPPQPEVESGGAPSNPDDGLEPTPSGEGGQPEVPLGMNPATGQLRGIAPGQAGMAPGGAPDVRMMLAGLSPNGKANLAYNVARRQAI